MNSKIGLLAILAIAIAGVVIAMEEGSSSLHVKTEGSAFRVSFMGNASVLAPYWEGSWGYTDDNNTTLRVEGVSELKVSQYRHADWDNYTLIERVEKVEGNIRTIHILSSVGEAWIVEVVDPSKGSISYTVQGGDVGGGTEWTQFMDYWLEEARSPVTISYEETPVTRCELGGWVGALVDSFED